MANAPGGVNNKGRCKRCPEREEHEGKTNKGKVYKFGFCAYYGKPCAWVAWNCPRVL